MQKVMTKQWLHWLGCETCTDQFYPAGQQLLTFSCSDPSHFPRKFSCGWLRRLQALWPSCCERLLHPPCSLVPVQCPMFHPPCPILHVPSLRAPGSTTVCRAGTAGVSGIPWVPHPVLVVLFHLEAALAQDSEDG